MLKNRLTQSLTALLSLAIGLTAAAQQPAPTPPLGWNSWDSYGLSITASEWKSNVDWFHQHLQPAGWQYVVLDEGWYLAHPENAGNKGDQGYTLNQVGQFIPAPSRFPQGIAGLATDAHALGLLFGIHIIRGIPKAAVDGSMPIAGTSFRAADAADTLDTCRWNPDNYGVRDNAPGQAYYDGLLKLYASWGIDFLKVDCIAKPYNTHEIHMIRSAIQRSGRPIVLSLSPGPTPLANAADASTNAQLWRISDDVWDVWSDPKLTPDSFPETIRNQFGVLNSWMPYQSSGHWPDADMLAIGYLGPRPGWGDPRQSRLSSDETRSLLTLWSIARSPLILGANLTRIDSSLESLLTNREFLAVNQQGSKPRQLLNEGNTIVWRSEAPGIAGQSDGTYLAVFNVGENSATLHLSWQQLGLSIGTHAFHDIWNTTDSTSSTGITVSLPKHASALYRVDLAGR